MQKHHYMVWDMGATKCAAALVEHDLASGHLHCFAEARATLRQYDSLFSLCDALLSQLPRSNELDAVCIAAAGRYNGRSLELATPYPYAMPLAELAEQRGWRRFAVTHDYTPAVCATFALADDIPDARCLNRGQAALQDRRVAFGIGTGLGLKDGVLHRNGDFWLGHNEAGHIGISQPPQASAKRLQQHTEFMHYLQQHADAPPLSFESILSGSGLVRLQQFVAGKEADWQAPCAATLDLFAWYLGLFTSTVQLALMPMGGIWISGGIVIKFPQLFDSPAFEEGLQSARAYQQERAHIPIYALGSHRHLFIGGAYYCAHRLCSQTRKELIHG